MVKSKAGGIYIKGHIVSVDKDKVVISVKNADTVYEKGQRVRATVSTMKKTALGRNVKVSEVIAQGTIAEVTEKTVTIHSRSSNPIISRKALFSGRKPKAEVKMKSI